MVVTWRVRWARQPQWARWVLVGYVAGFADGTAAHVRDLARGGFHAYSYAPVAVQAFFISLVFLDALVVVLVVLMCPAGAWLAAVVMAVDVAANCFVNWSLMTHDPLRLLRSGWLAISLFGLFVLASFIPLRRSFSAAGSPAWPGPDIVP